MDQDPTPDLEAALRAEPMLEPPDGLVDRVLAGLPAARRPRPVLHALARLAAAVVVALGAWVVAFGTAPGLAEAGLADVGPAPAIRDALGPALELVPDTAFELPALPVEPSDAPSIAGLAIAGLVVLLVGLILAYRVNRRSPS